MNRKIDGIFSLYSQIILFDLETTGLSLDNDQIIELAAIKYTNNKKSEIDILIKCPLNCPIPKSIVELTGITNKMLTEKGVIEEDGIEKFLNFLDLNDKALLISHNIQFDFSFLLNAIERYGKKIPVSYDILDTLTIFRDRKPYPNKLEDAIEYYNLENVKNSHRAIDDVKALDKFIQKLEDEQNDLKDYINLIGVHKIHGVWGHKIPRVTYCIQMMGEKKTRLPDFVKEGKRIY
jgi:DNA polymerase III, alpha subunit (gram-positive type)